MCWDIPTLKGLFSHQSIITGYNKWAGIDSTNIMISLFLGLNSSWSIRYNFAAYLNNTMTILPNKSLVENTGCDGSGTHCGIQNKHCKIFDRDVVIPDNIRFDNRRNKKLLKSFAPNNLRPSSIKIRLIYLINYHLFLKRTLLLLGVKKIGKYSLSY